MRILILFFVAFSLNANACWRLNGVISVNQNKLEINQKIDHDKTYTFPKGNLIYHLKMPSVFDLPENLNDKKGLHMVELNIQEKQGTKLVDLTQAKILVKKGQEATMTKEDGTTGSITRLSIKVEDI